MEEAVRGFLAHNYIHMTVVAQPSRAIAIHRADASTLYELLDILKSADVSHCEVRTCIRDVKKNKNQCLRVRGGDNDRYV